ncbi:MAG: hypothetical protein JWM76_5018 [Pseudonocardiales bacterium]|nr:hypothetical protein [Pseudonocardiales bacterium]
MFHNDDIAGSWQELVRRIEITDALGRWAASDDRLFGLRSVERDLVPRLALGADPARADEILSALLWRAAIDGGNDDDALLLMMHLQSDWVWPLATRLRDLGRGMVGVIVSELACQIRTYPWRTRRRAVAASLRWDTRHAVLAEFRPSIPHHRHRAELVLAPFSEEWEATPLGRALPGPDDDEDIDVMDLLEWVVQGGLDLGDVALVIRTEQVRADASVIGADSIVAAEFGLAKRTFYRRRSRTLTALRAAGRDYLAAVA